MRVNKARLTEWVEDIIAWGDGDNSQAWVDGIMDDINLGIIHPEVEALEKHTDSLISSLKRALDEGLISADLATTVEKLDWKMQHMTEYLESLKTGLRERPKRPLTAEEIRGTLQAHGLLHWKETVKGDGNETVIGTLSEVTEAILSALQPRPVECCGKCPPISGGGYDCTCAGNPRCSKFEEPRVSDE